MEMQKNKETNLNVYKTYTQRGSGVSRLLFNKVLKRDGLKCYLCEDYARNVNENDINIDHLVPVSHGGKTELINLAITHNFCNLHKANKLPHSMKPRLGLKTLQKMKEVSHPDYPELSKEFFEVRNTILVDFDSTVYPFLDVFSSIAKSDYNIVVSRNISYWDGLYNDFDSLKDANICVKKAVSASILSSVSPILNAASSLQDLANAGYNIVYVTDSSKVRGKAIVRWLKKHKFPNTDQVFCCSDKRSEIASLLPNLIAAVDDRVRTGVWILHTIGLPAVFSLRYSYNQNLSDVPGFYLEDTWPELKETIIRILPKAIDLDTF